MHRLQFAQIKKDLAEKMVLLTGPRQVGKTWLAKKIADSYQKSQVLNYDIVADRQVIEQQAWSIERGLLVLDELHKMPNWKNYLKGLFDGKSKDLHLLITGSAGLDAYRKIGDSLAGRYYRHRLLPFSWKELHQDATAITAVDWSDYAEFGGFPQPLFLKDRRWQLDYAESLLRTDVLDIAEIENLRALQNLFEMLRTRVGSPLSMASIAQDLHISIPTVDRYLNVLESVFLIFRVYPHHKNIARAIKRQPKVYFYNHAFVKGDSDLILENIAALSLLKNAFYRRDSLGEDVSLNYLRTRNGQEVDFAMVLAGELECIYEVKLSDTNLARSLKYFHDRLKVPALQLVLHNVTNARYGADFGVQDIRQWLLNLPV